MKWIKFAASFLSAFTICVTPLAQAAEKAETNKQLINEYLKETGLTTKQMTAVEYWRMVRHVYPPKIQSIMDRWVSLNREQLMPKIQASSFKDASGNEQVRLTLSRDGQSMTLTFTGDDDAPLKVNGVVLTKKELAKLDFNEIAHKVVNADATIRKSLEGGELPSLRKDPVMSYHDFNSMTAYQKGEYLLKLRQAIKAAQAVYTRTYGEKAMVDFNSKYKWAESILFGDDAEAAPSSLTGKVCVVAGYTSIYGEGGSCGGPSAGAANLTQQASVYPGVSCASGETPCNPLVYGFQPSGNAWCVPHAQVIKATAVCDQKAPIDTNERKAKLIESYMKKKGKDITIKMDADGKVSAEQLAKIKEGYLNDLNKYIDQAKDLCNNNTNFAKVQAAHPNQKDACDNLVIRGMDLQNFGACPVPPAVPNPPVDLPAGGACEDKVGSRLAADGKTCQCPTGTHDGKTNEDGKDKEACAPDGDTLIGKVPPKVDECDFFCRNKGWLIALGIGAIAVGGIFLLTHRKSHASTTSTTIYTPPAGPPQTICPTGEVLVGTLCQAPTDPTPPPVVVPPVTTTTEGGTGTNPNEPVGGVR